MRVHTSVGTVFDVKDVVPVLCAVVDVRDALYVLYWCCAVVVRDVECNKSICIWLVLIALIL